jgi:photoactive yellow protein
LPERQTRQRGNVAIQDLPTFDAHDIAATLDGMADHERDLLPFGVVEMDRDFTVLRYNATESRYAGLPPERVVGRHFFRDVAPCCNNRFVAQRYDLDTLDETVPYTFALQMRPVPVTLRMIKRRGSGRMYLLVIW